LTISSSFEPFSLAICRLAATAYDVAPRLTSDGSRFKTSKGAITILRALDG